jgi:hypothetical protein
MTRHRHVLPLVVCLVVLSTAPARAHHLNACFRPRVGMPGMEIMVCKAYRVEWNPSVHSPGAPYHPDRPSLVLFDRSTPRQNVRVVIPNARPGVYTINAYDGSEAGQHYFWATFRIVRPGLAGTGANEKLPASLAGVALAVALALLGTSRPHRHRRTRDCRV